MPKIVADKQIYHAVMQVVTERGYAGATTKQMAEAAEVSEVTLFRKYGSKGELVKQAVEAILQETDFEQATLYTGDIQADLLRIVETYQASAVKHGQFLAVIMTELPRYPELAEAIETPVRVMQAFGQLLARYQAEGILRSEPPLHTLAALLGPLIYTTMLRATLPDSTLPPLALAKHVTYFLQGRLVPPPKT